jgi:hypothetical protein
MLSDVFDELINIGTANAKRNVEKLTQIRLQKLTRLRIIFEMMARVKSLDQDSILR